MAFPISPASEMAIASDPEVETTFRIEAPRRPFRARIGYGVEPSAPELRSRNHARAAVKTRARMFRTASLLATIFRFMGPLHGISRQVTQSRVSAGGSHLEDSTPLHPSPKQQPCGLREQKKRGRWVFNSAVA